jgi:prevent-host-death family protein
MTAVGVRELKARLSHYLRLVRGGETVFITEHGRPVGRIVPFHATVEERLADLIAAGSVAWSGQPLRPIEPVARIDGSPTIADLLVEDRG